jgi:hypothetical protein
LLLTCFACCAVYLYIASSSNTLTAVVLILLTVQQ